MRIHFPNIDRPKTAAKLLSAAVADITLSKAQNALARAAGYRDWRELSRSPVAFGQFTTPDFPEYLALNRAIADDLAIESGYVHYALSRSRVIGPDHRSLKGMLKLRAMLRRACARKAGHNCAGTRKAKE